MQESKQVNNQQRRPRNRTRRKYVHSTEENNDIMPTELLLRGEDDTAVIHEACYPGNCTVLYCTVYLCANQTHIARRVGGDRVGFHDFKRDHRHNKHGGRLHCK